MTRRQDCNQRGFTLIGLLVVLVILGVLSAVVVFAVPGGGRKGTRVKGSVAESKKAAVVADERIIRTALETYCVQIGHYPVDPDGGGPKDAMDPLVEGGFLSSRSEYYTVESGDNESQGNCPARPKHYRLTVSSPTAP